MRMHQGSTGHSTIGWLTNRIRRMERGTLRSRSKRMPAGTFATRQALREMKWEWQRYLEAPTSIEY